MSHEIIPVVGDLADLSNKTFPGQGISYVKVDGFALPNRFEEIADAIEDFEVRDDDTWVCSFPKAGTTWTQEMVWCVANDLDFERAKESIHTRFPFLEHSCLIDNKRGNPYSTMPEYILDSIGFVDNLPSPRFIKSHLPFNLLPRQLRTGERKSKIVYVARNAKDTCISYFHHNKLLRGFQGDFEDFCTLFLGDTIPSAPFWKHVLSYWEKGAQENVLLLKFEDMKRDLPSVLKKTAKFLGKTLTTDQLSTLTEHLSFTSMKANPAVNNKELVADIQKFTNSKAKGDFMRCGNVDQWKTHMSPEFIERFDNRTCENFGRTHLFLPLNTNATSSRIVSLTFEGTRNVEDP